MTFHKLYFVSEDTEPCKVQVTCTKPVSNCCSNHLIQHIIYSLSHTHHTHATHTHTHTITCTQILTEKLWLENTDLKKTYLSIFMKIRLTRTRKCLRVLITLRFSPFEYCDFMVHNFKKIQVINSGYIIPLSTFLSIYLSYLSVYVSICFQVRKDPACPQCK